MLLETIKNFFGITKKKTILLSIPDSFPSWHSRYGEKTGFARKINGSNATKIHTIKSSVTFWENVCRTFSSGMYNVRIVHLEDTPKGKKYYPVKHSSFLHLQRANFDKDKKCLLVEGKQIALDTVARNEGYTSADFLEFVEKTGQDGFCIIHFTEFRY